MAKAKKKTAKKATKKTPAKARKKAASKRTKTAAKKAAPKRAAPKRQAAKKPAAKPAQSVQDLLKANPFLLDSYSSTPNAMENMMTNKQYEQFAQDAGEFGREGVEAMIKSSTIFAKGFEDLFRTGMSIAQETAEKQSQYMKEAMSSKTLNEWAEVQNKIAQANFEDFMAGATKISELSVQLLTDASEPLNSQMSKSIKKASQAAAA